MAFLKGEQKEMKYSLKELGISRDTARAFLGNRVYRVATGGRSTVATNGASLLSFPSLPAAQSVRLDSTCIPEFAAWLTLFDEVKVVGITWTYNPFNPYNRGGTVNSASIAFYWDDDTYGVSPTNSLSNMSAVSNRQPRYVEFSPDHTVRHEFRRTMSDSLIDWGDTTNLGVSYATSCAMGCISDGTLTANTIYGHVAYLLLLEFRARL
jgi:hypothetical protein